MNRLRTALFSMLAAAAAAAFAAGDDDVAVVFSTEGPDRYQDGTVVLDGECYALVWSKDGAFDGFSADGAPLDAADRVVRVGAVARGGRCNALFQIPSSLAAELETGVCAVYLLDTRVAGADGSVAPRGLAGGRLAVLNGYGEVSGTAVVKSGAGQVGMEARPAARAAKCAAAPADVAQPRILRIEPEEDRVVLYVENLPGHIRVQSGADVAAADSASPAVAADGGGGPVRIEVPKTGSAGFFRSVRSSL